MTAKSLSTTILISLLLTFSSCEVIYNYDLSVSGLDDLPATKSVIEKYLPHSVNAQKDRQYNEIKSTANVLNDHEEEILDSLIADSINIDSSYTLKFTILALDPENEITEVEIEKQYFLKSE